MIRTYCLASLLFISASCFGVDLELSTRLDNLYWSPTNMDDAKGHIFTGSPIFWTVEGSVSQDLADGLTFKGGIQNDPVLRSRIYSQIGFSLESITLKFAPFLGTFNSMKWFNPGFEALVEYTLPGIFFVKGGFLTTFAPVSKSGDYYLSSLTASAGTLLENGILSFNIVDKAATFRLDDFSTVDASTKYWLDLEMFLKNVPLRWAFILGYQLTNRSYITDTETQTPVHSVLIGGRLSWDFGRGTTAFIEGQSAFFQQGWDATTLRVPASTGIFQAVSGVRYHW